MFSVGDLGDRDTSRLISGKFTFPALTVNLPKFRNVPPPPLNDAHRWGLLSLPASGIASIGIAIE
jgi:hypothetical protein